jgi:hypothetical protein
MLALLEARYGRGNSLADSNAPVGRAAYNVPNVPGTATVIGVYRVRAKEPCWLIELRIDGLEKSFDLADLTQPITGRGRSFWQAPYEEVLLDASGTRIKARAAELKAQPDLLKGEVRLAFFFHYLDFEQPLLSPFGDLPIPKPTPRPSRLKMLKYEAPD